MAAIIITVILVAAIIGVSSWLIAVRAKSGKYNLIKVKKSGVPNAVSGDPEEYDVEVNGINMHYAVMGKGSPLILIHGNGGSHEELLGLMRYFANDYRVPPAYFDPSCGNAADLFCAIFFYYHIYNYLLSSLSKHYSNEIAVCHFSKLYIIYNFNNGYGRKRLKNPDTACLRSSLPCFRKLILSFNTRG